MSQKRYYCQCCLSKDNLTTLSYLPQKYAVLNKRIQLKNEDGSWDRGWIVKSVGEPKDAEWIEARTNIWKPSTILTERGKK